MPIGSRIFPKLGGGIGMAVEAYQHHKDKGRTESNADQSQTGHHSDRSSTSEESEIEDDEATWALDEAAQELMPSPPPYSEVDSYIKSDARQEKETITETEMATKTESGNENENEKNLAKAFLAKHPLNNMHAPRLQLPVPVVIPQRRPREAQRGFVLAYPPLLEECAGIDQSTFLDFLDTFNRSCFSSQAFDVLNVASFAVGFVPSATGIIASKAISTASAVGQETQSRAQRNAFLDRVNEGFFRPRGLWSMIVTWQPESQQTIIPNRSLRSSAHSSSNYNTTALQPGHTHNTTNILTSSSGTTQGDIPLAECAPLIYPPIDRAATSTQQIPLAKHSKLQSSQDFIAKYIDKRRAAEFAGLHPTSAVSYSSQPQTHTSSSFDNNTFTSRWADPNHPTNSGTLLGLVSGGTIDPRAHRRGERAQRQAARRGGPELTDEQVRLAQMGRLDRRGNVREQFGVGARVGRVTGGGRKGVTGGVRRMIRQDVCYLMIVSYPK